MEYRRLFRNAPVPELILSAEDGAILEANKKAESLLEDFGALAGRSFSGLFLSTETADQCLDQCRRSQEAKACLPLAAPQGRKIPLDVAAHLSRDGDNAVIHVALNDASAKHRAEEKLLASNKLLAATGLAQSRFLSDVPTQTIFLDLLDTFLELTQSEFGLIAEFQRTEGNLPYFKVKAVSRNFWNSMSRDFYAKNAPIGMEFYNLNSLLGSVIKSGAPVITNTPHGDGRSAGLPEGHPPINSFLGLPFFSGKKAVGMVCLANRPGGYDEEVGQFLKPLLDTCGSLFSAYSNNQWRKEAEAKLRRQALVFKNISDGVILTDYDGRIVDCNPAASKKFGFSKFEMLGAPIDFIGDAKYKKRLLPSIRQSIEKRSRWSGILEIVDRKGKERIFETAVVPLRNQEEDEGTLVWFNRDVTENKAAQKRLDQRSREMDAIFALSPDGFVFIDHNRNISYLNPALERMTGLKAKKFIGQDAEKLDLALAPLLDPAHPCPAGNSDEDSAECTLHLLRPRLTILKRVVRHLRDKAGALQGMVLYFHDITYESEVDRMKSEFLSTAAHELRTPMASVYGFSELLLKREFPVEKRQELLDIIHRQAGHLVALLNELLDLARIEAQAGKDFCLVAQDIVPVIRSTLAQLLIPGDARQVEATLPKTLPPVTVDGEKLQLILTNVLSNAYKYSLGKGRIELAIKAREKDDEKWVGIAVRDQGIGMAPEQASRIFERFYRADASGKIPGTGLGMSIVKEIMDIFGGEVEVQSQPGKGTEVTLWCIETGEQP